MTLEQLYHSDLSDDATATEYGRRRTAKVQEIAAYIADRLEHPHIATLLAASIMANAEEMGWLDGDTVGGEIASRYTISGNPLPFTI